MAVPGPLLRLDATAGHPLTLATDTRRSSPGGRPNGVGDGRGGDYESGAAVVVDRNDGDGRVRLFCRYALVSGYESSEAAAFGCCQ